MVFGRLPLCELVFSSETKRCSIPDSLINRRGQGLSASALGEKYRYPRVARMSKMKSEAEKYGRQCKVMPCYPHHCPMTVTNT